MRTRSLRMTADSPTVMSGETKEIAVASTTGSRASDEKLQNMAPTAVAPRPTWANGRPVRSFQLAAPRVDDNHRQDRASGTEEHDLSDRITLSQIAHQHRHDGEQQ